MVAGAAEAKPLRSAPILGFAGAMGRGRVQPSGAQSPQHVDVQPRLLLTSEGCDWAMPHLIVLPTLMAWL